MILRGDCLFRHLSSHHLFGCYHAMVVINIILSIGGYYIFINISMPNQSDSGRKVGVIRVYKPVDYFNKFFFLFF